MAAECFFKAYSRRPCTGPLDPAHLISKQEIRRKLGGDEHVWDERVYVPACRQHHADFDHYNLLVPRCAIPESVHQFAHEHGLENALDRDRRYVN